MIYHRSQSHQTDSPRDKRRKIDLEIARAPHFDPLSHRRFSRTTSTRDLKAEFPKLPPVNPKTLNLLHILSANPGEETSVGPFFNYFVKWV
jgi:hypothetical protein